MEEKKPTITELEAILNRQEIEIMPDGSIKARDCDGCATLRTENAKLKADLDRVSKGTWSKEIAKQCRKAMDAESRAEEAEARVERLRDALLLHRSQPRHFFGCLGRCVENAPHTPGEIICQKSWKALADTEPKAGGEG